MAAETRPATQVALDSITPGVTEQLQNQGSAAYSQQMDMDPFDEDEVELRFLLSKPTCFIVLGKPGAGKSSLAKKLAQTWQCQLVNATELILQDIALQTDLGKKLQEILLRGEMIPEETAARMVEEKINSPEVRHHGYVIDDFPCMSEEYMKVADQLALIKNWDLKPDFIINLRIPDRDLVKRRSGQRVDPVTSLIYTREIWSPDKPDTKTVKGGEGEEDDGGSDDEEEEEEGGDEDGGDDEFPEETVELSMETIERLVQRPEDLSVQVTSSVHLYKQKLLKMFEDYMADHDQQYLIELDANKSVSQLFRELMARLNTFSLRRAAVPIRLTNADEEDIPDDIDTEELMRTLSGTHMVAPRYRWRRSKWARACPIQLQKGNVVMGKPEFAVGFLDKIYVMSNHDAMRQFVKNPRPFLVSPQPRPPCKLCVVGPPLSGKTTLCHALGQKLNAKVLDIDVLIKSRYEAHKAKQVELARQEAIEAAMANVKAKLKEKEETAAAADSDAEEEPAKGTEHPLPQEEGSLPDGEEKTNDAGDEPDTQAEAQAATDDIQADTQVAADGQPELGAVEEGVEGAESQDAPEPEVDLSHPEVRAAAEQAELDANKLSYTLAPEQYVDCLEEAINEVHQELRSGSPTGPHAGGWIVDNFPTTREHWSVLMERGLAPDEVVYLKEAGEGSTYLLKRWYQLNKAEIDTKVRLRKEAEEEEKAKALEEARLQHLGESKEEEKDPAEMEEEEEAAEGMPRTDPEGTQEEPTESGQSPEGDKLQDIEEPLKADDAETVDQPPGREETSPAGLPSGEQTPMDAAPPEKTVSVDEKPHQQGRSTTGAEETFEVPVEDLLPPAGPETQQFKERKAEFDKDWPSVQALLTITLEPLPIDIENKTKDEVLKMAHTKVEEPYTYRPADYTSIDLDEEDEDAENADDSMEEEEDEEVAKNRKKQFGDSKHFCPVAFREDFVLWPGNPDIGCKYREKVYYFANQENKEKFMEDPNLYVAKGQPFKPPPVRILLLGPRGAGKSSHGRQLAEELGIFHIDFKERLQELIIGKTKKRIVPEIEEEPEEPDSEGEEEDGDVKDDSAKLEQTKSQEETGGLEDAVEPELLQELTEEEENIKGHLRGEESLSLETVEKIITDWWKEEPFKNTGFILEGFPRTTEEAQFLADKGFFPDAAVVLNVDSEVITSRLLPPKMEKWKCRRDKTLARRERKKEKKRKERDAAMSKRRAELELEAAEKKAEKMAQKAAGADSDDSEGSDDEEEEDDIDATLAEEFEEDEEDDEELELEEDAEERLKNEISEMYDDDTNGLASVQETLEEILIPRMEIDGGRKPHIVRYSLRQTLLPIVECRESLYEKVYPVRENIAQKMLQIGYKHPSRFGRWCPVRLSEGDCIQPMQGPGYPSFPVQYRQHVYSLSSPQHRDKFVMDPIKYLKQPSPGPAVPIKMAIIGPPKSGKTALGNRFASEYGIIRLSIGEAIRYVLNQQPTTELADQINAHLKKGAVIPDEMATRALEVALLDSKANTRGYILDGYPVTKPQVDLLSEFNIIPVVVLELQVDSRELMVRGMKDRHTTLRSLPLHDSAQILAIRIAAWQKEVTAVREFYKEQHSNWVPVDGERSKWWVWNEAVEQGKRSVRRVQQYLQRVAEGKAVSIANLCITPKEFLSRLGDFGQYCPVSLASDGELVDCAPHQGLDLAAEFRGRYYKMETEEKLGEFLSRPEQYVPPMAPRHLPPPEMLPRRRTRVEVKTMFPTRLELQGYCPVTYLDGKLRYEALIPGDASLVVEYREKLYCFENEQKLHKFMRLPEKYHSLRLPHKLPPRKDPLQVTSLPMLGYMEQTVSTAITKALTAVGLFKPKFPFLSPSRSALIYVAFHLKAYNPKSSDYVRKKYKRKLQQFEENCELIAYLGNNMSKHYREPRERPIDFDHKLGMFLNLRGIEPSPTWVV